jgi:cytochrome c peroxidase
MFMVTALVAPIVGGVSVSGLGSGDAADPASRSVQLARERPPVAGAYAALGAEKLSHAYDAWVTAHESAGGDRNVRVSLTYSRALSREFTRAFGTARLDLLDGRVELEVQGLPPGEFEAWLVDNRPAERASVRAEQGDVQASLGSLARDGRAARLSVTLGSGAFAQMQPDLVVIAEKGRGPGDGLLYGSSPLFQRLYTALRTPELLRVSDYAPREERAPRSLLGVSAAYAGEIIVDPDVLLSELVATGADLFINETFDGNGRTCATCHPLTSNTQLTISEITALSDTDPLFAAEFIPALAFDPNGPKFEVPVLMRGAGLIVENVDGMDDLVNKFTLRSIPHTLGLSTSLTPNLTDGTTIPPFQRTGWSGDGAPGGGTLRDFATGAVTQHFPLTLARIPGLDFRLPTDPELDAMEAFQLTLGRSEDLTLPLALLDPKIARGQQVFMSDASRCNTCHSNASANVGSGTNRNFNTGVEDQVDRPAQVILEALNLDLTPDVPGLAPRDGGFGAAPGNLIDGFGNGTFNTPPLVEAADTGPFFHDNQLRTIEGAVAFYNGTSFAASPSGSPLIDLQPTEIEEVAAFLRAINALENIRASRDLAVALQGLHPRERARVGRPLVAQAALEIDDAIEVLAQVDLQPAAVDDLRAARALIPANPRGAALHPGTAAAIIAFLDSARARIVE